MKRDLLHNRSFFLPAINRVHQARSEDERSDRPTRTSAGDADFEAGVTCKYDNAYTAIPLYRYSILTNLYTSIPITWSVGVHTDAIINLFVGSLVIPDISTKMGKNLYKPYCFCFFSVVPFLLMVTPEQCNETINIT